MTREARNNNEQQRYYLYPGYIFASANHTFISTVLGSCVSVCLFDTRNKFGGMNHFIYPKSHKDQRNAKYGDVATKHLFRLMYKLGSQKTDLTAHIIGGANNLKLSGDVGGKNVKVAEKIVAREGIDVLIRDVGGQRGRKLVFDTCSGELLIHKGVIIREGDWYQEN